MEELTSLTQEIQSGIAYAKAFVTLREKRIAILEERLANTQHQLEMWKAIAEELARQQAFCLNHGCQQIDEH